MPGCPRATLSDMIPSPALRAHCSAMALVQDDQSLTRTRPRCARQSMGQFAASASATNKDQTRSGVERCGL